MQNCFNRLKPNEKYINDRIVHFSHYFHNSKMKRTSRNPKVIMPLPSHPQRLVLEEAFGGVYRRIRFTSSQPCPTIHMFIEDIRAILTETIKLMSQNRCNFKICSALIITADQKREYIYLNVPATLLSIIFVEEMEERLVASLEDHPIFSLDSVVALDWKVAQCV